MLRFFSRESPDRDLNQGGRPGRRGRGRVRRRGRLLLCLEGLETRITPSTVHWTGSGGDSSWINAGNWDSAPQTGDDLVFPNGPTSLVANNDFVAATFNSITIEAPGYALTGNALSLT